MNTTIDKEALINKEKSIDSNPITKNITKNIIESNFELNLLEGTEAYYSERYGWTLRRSK